MRKLSALHQGDKKHFVHIVHAYNCHLKVELNRINRTERENITFTLTFLLVFEKKKKKKFLLTLNEVKVIKQIYERVMFNGVSRLYRQSGTVR